MDHLIDSGEIDFVFGRHGIDAGQDALLRTGVGGQHLGRLERTVVELDHDVGERAADVGADADGHEMSSSFGKSDGGLMSTVAERCWASMPPSTRMMSPVIYEASSEAKNSAAPVMS